MIGSIKVPLVVLHHFCVQQRGGGGVGCVAITDVVIWGHCYDLYVVVLCEQTGTGRVERRNEIA